MAKTADIIATTPFLNWRTDFNTLKNYSPEVIISPATAPLSTDYNYDVPAIWIKEDTDTAYILTHAGAGPATGVWVQLGSTPGALVASGIVPLTDNWNAGPYTITASRFVSTVAIGTEPFTVTSTTMVNNLDAQYLGDTGQDSAFHRARANHTGTQLLSSISDKGALASLSTITPAEVIVSATDKLVGRDAAASGACTEIGLGGGLEFDGINNLKRSALSGDIVATAGSGATLIQPGVVTLAKMESRNGATIIGRRSGAAAVPEEISLGVGIEFNSSTIRRAPITGDVSVPNTNNVATIAAGAVTPAKMAVVNASGQTFLGKNTPSAGAPEELSVATAKTMLGLDLGVPLTSALLLNQTYSGDWASMPISGTVNFGDVLYMNSSGDLAVADADVESQIVIAMAVEAGTGGTRKVLMRGFVRVDTWPAMTRGLPVFNHTASPWISTTAPSGSGDRIQVVGFVTQQDPGDPGKIIYFNPAPSWATA